MVSKLEDVYGKNFINDSMNSKIEQIINTISNNMSHRHFIYNLDSSSLWNIKNINLEHVIKIINNISNINKNLIAIHINKNSDQINLIHTLINGINVEYFIIIDKEYMKIYCVYLTPVDMGMI